MTALTDSSVSIMTAFRQTNGLLIQMEQLLERQYSYLLSRDMISLEQECRRLTELLEELGVDAAQRNQTLTSRGLTLDGVGMEQLLTGLSADCQDEGRQLWIAIRKRMVNCRDMNQMNGRLQRRLKSANTRLAELFWGYAVANPSYNQGGQLERPSSLRNIGRV
ncbi:MAG: flagellar protein FlgN [Endozoicomonadaceae bacterium]|nr:flagellar protein FlgN [Endozoicomonadaceae bacterium]